jgi:hypothetical protein
MSFLWQRFNNPGNVSLPIQGWSGGGSVVGAPGQPGYAAFPSMGVGYQAFEQRLLNYIDVKGYDTIAKLPYATDPNWKAAVSDISGIGLNTPLDTNNSNQMQALEKGILSQEIGSGGANQVLASNSSIFGGSANNPQVADASGQTWSGSVSTMPDGSVNDASGGAQGTDQAATGQSPNDISVSSWANPNTPYRLPADMGGSQQTSGDSFGKTLSGLWEAMGVTATTQAGDTVAKGSTTAANTVKQALSDAAKALTQSADKNTALAAKSSTANVQSAEKTGTGWLDSIFSNTKDLFQRWVIGMFGLILILGAAVYLSRSSTPQRA